MPAGTLNCVADWESGFLQVKRTSSKTRELKQIATAGATTAAVTEKVWGEYVSTVRQI